MIVRRMRLNTINLLFFACIFGILLSSKVFSRVTSENENAPLESCLGAACHGSYSDVAELTRDIEPNPHSSHLGEVRCTVCHKSEGKSTFYCNKCHVNVDLNVP